MCGECVCAYVSYILFVKSAISIVFCILCFETYPLVGLVLCNISAGHMYLSEYQNIYASRQQQQKSVICAWHATIYNMFVTWNTQVAPGLAYNGSWASWHPRDSVSSWLMVRVGCFYQPSRHSGRSSFCVCTDNI